jgi:hypothetical protein
MFKVVATIDFIRLIVQLICCPSIHRRGRDPTTSTGLPDLTTEKGKMAFFKPKGEFLKEKNATYWTFASFMEEP